jgi:hypothetical protein
VFVQEQGVSQQLQARTDVWNSIAVGRSMTLVARQHTESFHTHTHNTAKYHLSTHTHIRTAMQPSQHPLHFFTYMHKTHVHGAVEQLKDVQQHLCGPCGHPAALLLPPCTCSPGPLPLWLGGVTQCHRRQPHHKAAARAHSKQSSASHNTLVMVYVDRYTQEMYKWHTQVPVPHAGRLQHQFSMLLSYLWLQYHSPASKRVLLSHQAGVVHWATATHKVS